MITVPGPAQPAAAGDRAAAAPAVRVEGLRKHYGDVTALAGVDAGVSLILVEDAVGAGSTPEAADAARTVLRPFVRLTPSRRLMVRSLEVVS